MATRIAVETIPATTAWDEIAVCTIWLNFAALMMYCRAWVPGFLYALSALTYPAFVTFGLYIGWLALPNIIAEVFAVFALLFIGGGIGGLLLSSRSSGNNRRRSDRLAVASLGVATNTFGHVSKGG